MAKEEYADLVSRAVELGIAIPGYRLLAIEIIHRAALDLRLLDKAGKSSRVHYGAPISSEELENFFNSGWCEALLVGTNYSSEELKEMIYGGKRKWHQHRTTAGGPAAAT